MMSGTTTTTLPEPGDDAPRRRRNPRRLRRGGAHATDRAHRLLRRRRTRLVRLVQHDIVRRLMLVPTLRADDLDDFVDGITPPGIDPDFVGAAFRWLAEMNVISRLAAEPENVNRGGRHGNLLRRWRLAIDHDAARHWLATHPIPPATEPSDGAH